MTNLDTAVHAEKNNGYKFDSTILRASDIRGIMGETLSTSDALHIGKAFATSVIRQTGITNPNIAVAYDGRLSSPEMADALIDGLKSTGAYVTNYGCGPSPMLYFTNYHHDMDAGIMVTGSHNPPSYNGFKMMLQKKSFFGDSIKAFADMALNNDFITSDDGTSTDVSIYEDYIGALASGFLPENAKDLKTAWDPGNGASGDIVEQLVKCLPGEHIVINGKVDGTFPAHHPDPTIPENLQQLMDVVRDEKCDLGVAFDGDGDRVAAIDANGRIIWGDQLMILFARDILAENPDAPIIADVKSSQTLFDDIAKHGGRPIIWKTGHSFIKSKMAEEKALLAGEMSGHIFFADRYHGFDDGVYAAIRLLNLVAHSDVSLVDTIDALPTVFNTPEIRIHTTEERKFIIIQEVKIRLEKAKAEVNDIDGARVKNEHGWWLMRASNTESAIIVRCEGHNEASLGILKQQVIEQLKLSNADFAPLI